METRTGLRVSDRALLIMVSALAVIPIWVAAIRSGLDDIFPTADVALVILRARDVFSAHPPLIGMMAAGASGPDLEVHFPGAIQLYLLAVPVQLFGNVWGPALGMAAINSLWVVLLCRILWRRLGTTGALLGIGFVTAFLWSIGSGYLITPVPMHMVMIPFLLFVFAVWSVADGDLGTIPVLAIVANYLFLDHLVLVLLVPVVGLCAPVGLWLWIRNEKRTDPDGHRARIDRLKAKSLWALGITLVMWLPSIIQQFTTDPGNLSQLFSSAGADRSSAGSWTYAMHVTIGVLARPPFWFRNSMDRPGAVMPSTDQSLVGYFNLADAIALTVMAAILAVCFVVSIRRQDRQSTTLLIVAVVAVIVNLPNIYLAPNDLGVIGYVKSLWSIAAFIWFAVACTTLKALNRPLRQRLRWPLALACGLLVVLNLPARPILDMQGRTSDVASTMNRSVVPQLLGLDEVYFRSTLGFENHTYWSALALALDTADVDFCVDDHASPQLGHWRRCDGDPSAMVTVKVHSERVQDEGVLAQVPFLSKSEKQELVRLERRVEAWLGTLKRLTLTEQAKHIVVALGSPETVEEFQKVLNPAGGDLRGLVDNPIFVGISALGASEVLGEDATPFTASGISARTLGRWARLSRANKYVVVRARQN